METSNIPPTINSEMEELKQRLIRLEEDIITDEIVEESVLKAFEFLEKIYGEKFIQRTTAELKRRKETADLKEAIKKAIKKNLCICQGNAGASFPNIEVYKNSFLSDFLVHKNRMSMVEQQRITDFFKKANPEIEKAIASGDAEQVKKHLEEYISVLEEEKDLLLKNIELIRKELSNNSSLEVVLLHEVMHWIFFIESYYGKNSYGNNYDSGVDESAAYSIQLLNHVYDKDYVFSRENFEAEIKRLKDKFSVIGRIGYGSYKWQKVLIPLFCAIIFSDALKRKEGNLADKGLFSKAHSTRSFLELFKYAQESIRGLPGSEMKELIEKRLLEFSMNELKKTKTMIDEEISNALKFLKDNLRTERFKQLGGKDFSQRFKSLINIIIKQSIMPFLNSIYLLKEMDCEDEARNHGNRYNQLLDEMLKSFFAELDEQERNIIETDGEAIRVIVKAIDKEESYLKESIESLTNWRWH